MFYFCILLGEFAGAFERPDGFDAHGAPGFAVDVVKGDCLPVVGGLLLGGTFSLGHIVRWDEVGAGCTAGLAERAVDLLELEDHDAFIEGLF